MPYYYYIVVCMHIQYVHATKQCEALLISFVLHSYSTYAAPYEDPLPEVQLQSNPAYEMVNMPSPGPINL